MSRWVTVKTVKAQTKLELIAITVIVLVVAWKARITPGDRRTKGQHKCGTCGRRMRWFPGAWNYYDGDYKCPSGCR